MSKISPFPLTSWFRRKQNGPRARDYRLLKSIRKQADEFRADSDIHLKSKTEDLRASLQKDQILDEQIVTIAFGLITEALRRTTGKVYYDVQLLGGLILATGCVAEMQTGEGKTITCGLASILYGMLGQGVHVATTNAYLAERDFEELEPIIQLLGLTAGRIQSDQSPGEKRNAYACDITYGTGYEFGFDFLRDQVAMRNRPKQPLGTQFLAQLRGLKTFELQLLQRELHFAIIDEADSVLIDEAATPLILSSSQSSRSSDIQVYLHARNVADDLIDGTDFHIHEITTRIELTDSGWKTVHQRLTPIVQQKLSRPWSQYIEQALRARLILQKDVDYVVRDNKIVFVDQNTGRLHEERKWRSGLHQAIEVRENVPLSEEREIEARISRQKYFQFYDRISGMTGTVQGNEKELAEFYRLPVVKIPRNKPSRRIKLPSRFFVDEQSKFEAIARDVHNRRQTGQPVLIGTSTIRQSMDLAEALNDLGIQHELLNGTQDKEEAQIVAEAGQAGRVMIATNMAGRGTDIRLDEVARGAGGLHVIAAEHQESSRVDRQLIGRCGRQNDPGSCQFFVSAEDEIIKRYDEYLSKSIASNAKSNGETVSNFEQHIDRLQQTIEKIRFDGRRKMVIHDKWLESVQESVAKLA